MCDRGAAWRGGQVSLLRSFYNYSTCIHSLFFVSVRPFKRSLFSFGSPSLIFFICLTRVAARCLWDSDTDSHAQDIFVSVSGIFVIVCGWWVFYKTRLFSQCLHSSPSSLSGYPLLRRNSIRCLSLLMARLVKGKKSSGRGWRWRCT